jgi:hypothetical protein
MTFVRSNTAEGGTSGATVTTANSGGASGDAFSAVSIGSGSTLICTNALAFSGTKSYQFAETTSHAVTANWTITGVAGPLYARSYIYFQSTAGPGYAYFVSGGTGSMTVVVSSAGKVQVLCSGVTTLTSTTVLSANTWYRIEAQFTFGTGTSQAVMRLYDASGTLLETLTTAATGTVTGATTLAFGSSGTTTVTYNMDNLAASDQGWIGPYVAPAGNSGQFLALMS